MKEYQIFFGFYPGILLGIRSYHDSVSDIHVLYLPLIEFGIEIFHEE